MHEYQVTTFVSEPKLRSCDQTGAGEFDYLSSLKNSNHHHARLRCPRTRTARARIRSRFDSLSASSKSLSARCAARTSRFVRCSPPAVSSQRANFSAFDENRKCVILRVPSSSHSTQYPAVLCPQATSRTWAILSKNVGLVISAAFESTSFLQRLPKWKRTAESRHYVARVFAFLRRCLRRPYRASREAVPMCPV